MTQLHTLVESCVFPSHTCSYWPSNLHTLGSQGASARCVLFDWKPIHPPASRRGVKLVPPTSHGSNRGSLVPNSSHQSSELKRCWLKCFFSQVVLIDVFQGDRTFVSLLLLETAAQICVDHCFLHSVSIIECYIFLNKLQTSITALLVLLFSYSIFWISRRSVFQGEPMKLKALLAEAVWSRQTSVWRRSLR